MDDALLVLLLTAAACAPLGVFLILRRLSMMADAISHTVLLGIVLAFFVTHDLGSPWLLFGAALMGVVTVSLVELLGKTRLVKYDDAIGVIFPLLFALAVILISKYAGNAHLDTDMVLMGEVIYAGLNTVGIGGVEIPSSALKMGGLALLIAVFITVFYKELKVFVFDAEYAQAAGLPVRLLHVLLPLLTIAVIGIGIKAVGAILISSFLIIPCVAASQWSNDFSRVLLLSAVFGMAAALLGTYVSTIESGMSTGPSIILAACAIAFLSMLCGKWGVLRRRLRREKE